MFRSWVRTMWSCWSARRTERARGRIARIIEDHPRTRDGGRALHDHTATLDNIEPRHQRRAGRALKQDLAIDARAKGVRATRVNGRTKAWQTGRAGIGGRAGNWQVSQRVAKGGDMGRRRSDAARARVMKAADNLDAGGSDTRSAGERQCSARAGIDFQNPGILMLAEPESDTAPLAVPLRT